MEFLHTFPSEHPIGVAAISLTACYGIYYIFWVVKRPILVSGNGEWKKFLVKNLPILQEFYWPTPWCIDGRFQSVFGSVVRCRLTDIHYERQVFELKDGGIISLDWLSRPQRKDHPILVILPGLTGTSQSGYVKGIINGIQDIDTSCVVLNYRGMADTELKTTRAFCKANCDDFEEVLEHIHFTYPEAPVVAAGISLGGLWVANYLATRSERASKIVTAAIVFSIPWDMFAATENLETPGWNMVINYAMTRSLCNIYESHRKKLDVDEKKVPWSTEHIMKSKTIRQFDNRFTALNFGYKDVDEYYTAGRLYDKVHDIKVPLLCLAAEDDFFLPIKGVPLANAQKSNHVAIIVTSYGGHVGFMEGLFPYKTYYSDRIFVQFYKSVLSDIMKIKQMRNEGTE